MRIATIFALAVIGLVAMPHSLAIDRAAAQGVSRPAATASGKAPWPQSPWVKSHSAAARLIAGSEPAENGGRKIVVGVEITMADGWKTYWRHPGDDGGLPPTFQFQQSRNLKSATVKYPVPDRLKSLGGTAVGYSHQVVFPVEIEAVDPAGPVEVVLELEYGICKDICVPAEARLSLVIDPKLSAVPPDLAQSIARVPQSISAAAAHKVIRSAKVVLSGPQPSISFEVAAKELFVVPPAGFQVPVPAKTGDAGGGYHRFRIDLKGIEDAPKLAGKTLSVVASGPGGNFELEWLVK